MADQNKVEASVLRQSMVGAFLLAVWGIVMAVISGAGIVLLDGMFNLISAIMTFFSIEIIGLASGRETREYPLGYFAFESLFIFIKGAAIMILILMALYGSIRTLLSGGRTPELGLMTLYVIFAVLGCLLLFILTRRGFRKTGSEILGAEKASWLINTVVSGSIGVAFGITMLIQETQIGWVARYVDQILVILFSIFFVRDPLVLMKNGLKELLLSAPQGEFAAPFEEKILPLKDQLGAKDLSLEIMKTGRRIWVTVTMDPLEDTITMDAFMKMKQDLKEIAREVYENTDTEIIIDRA
jgi:predicted Co/Zn/Cd cation transporter (cation efflux family)